MSSNWRQKRYNSWKKITLQETNISHHGKVATSSNQSAKQDGILNLGPKVFPKIICRYSLQMKFSNLPKNSHVGSKMENPHNIHDYHPKQCNLNGWTMIFCRFLGVSLNEPRQKKHYIFSSPLKTAQPTRIFYSCTPWPRCHFHRSLGFLGLLRNEKRDSQEAMEIKYASIIHCIYNQDILYI